MFQDDKIESVPLSTQPQSTFSSPSYSSPRGPRKIGVVLRWVILFLIAGLLIFAGVSFFRAQQSEKVEEITPTPTVEAPTATPTPESTTPTPTKKPTVTPTKAPTPTKAATSSATTSKGLTIKVLNGGGVGGKAKEASEYFVSLGYTVQSIGNAENSPNYDKGEIQITKAKESMLATLRKDVEGKYTVGTTSSTLSTSEGVDAIVIIGKQ